MKQLVIVGAGGMGRTFYSNALESVGSVSFTHLPAPQTSRKNT